MSFTKDQVHQQAKVVGVKSAILLAISRMSKKELADFNDVCADRTYKNSEIGRALRAAGYQVADNSVSRYRVEMGY